MQALAAAESAVLSPEDADSCTCCTCNLKFPSHDEVRAHYQTELHKFNSKRRGVGYPPVTGEVFETARRAALARAAAYRAVQEGATRDEAAEAAKLAAKKGALAPVQKVLAPDGSMVVPAGRRWHCELTGKSFASRQQYENHLKSRKYRDAARAAAQLRQRAAADRAIEGGDAAAVAATASGSSAYAAGSSTELSLLGPSARGGLGAAEAPLVPEPPRIQVLAESRADARRRARGLPVGPEAAAAGEAREEGDDESVEGDEGPLEEKEAEELSLPPELEGMTVESHCMFDLQPVYGGLHGHLKRARERYGFRIPDAKWLSDLPGLVEYCMSKALVGRRCLYCDRQFHEYQACLEHMRASNHCRLPVDKQDDAGMDEYAGFYDYEQEDPERVRARLERRAGRAGREPVLPDVLRLKFMGAEARLQALAAMPKAIRDAEAAGKGKDKGKDKGKGKLMLLGSAGDSARAGDPSARGAEEKGDGSKTSSASSAGRAGDPSAAAGGATAAAEGDAEAEGVLSLPPGEAEAAWMYDSDSEGEGPPEFDVELLDTGELMLPSGRVAGNKEHLDVYRKRARHGARLDARARQMPIVEAHARTLTRIGFARADAAAAARQFAREGRESRRGLEQDGEEPEGEEEVGGGSRIRGPSRGSAAAAVDEEEVARGVSLLRSYQQVGGSAVDVDGMPMAVRMRGRGADSSALAKSSGKGLAALRRRDPTVRKAEGQRTRAMARRGRDMLKTGMTHNVMQGRYFRSQVVQYEM